MTEPSFLDMIAEHSKDFTETQQLIAEFILSDPSCVAFMNARELGEAVGVSESSVVRFAYSAGFDGYRHLQAAAKKLVNQRLSMHERYLHRPQFTGDIVHTSVRAGIRNLESLERSTSSSEIERAAAQLAQARRCYVLGYREAAGLAIIAYSAISRLCHNCIQLSFDAGETIDLLVGAGSQDVLLAISFRRYARRTLHIAEFAHKHGVFVIAITDSLFSPLREYADILLVGNVESPNFSYSLIAPLCIIDSLVLALSEQMGDAAAASIKEWEETYGHFDLLEELDTT